MELFRDHPEAYPVSPLWRGIVERVHDGDTYKVAVDTGFEGATSVWLRLDNADTPELYSGSVSEKVRGFNVATALAELLIARPVRFWTRKSDASPGAQQQSFVRYRAVRLEFWDDEGWRDLATYLFFHGYNKPEFIFKEEGK